MFATSLFAALLLIVAGVLGDALRREWRRVEALPEETPGGELRYARRRLLRRGAANGVIALVGLLLAVWPVVPREPVWAGGYMAALLLLTVLLLGFALADAIATGRHYHRVAEQELLEQTAELKEAIKATRPDLIDSPQPDP